MVPCGPGPVVGGVGCGGGFGTTTGVILVLFILLVIILRATRL
ncbi:sporulation protein YjcZ [Paenibacillus guangzhouensis]|nr:sporulation protein YjcZ [Paenibacillus guangzhouensis]